MRPLLALLCAVLCVLSPAAVAGLAVSPGIIERELVAGDNTLELIVSNNSDKPMDVELATGPLGHDVQGRSVAGKPDAALDASGLIRFEKPSFVLPARRWRRVRAHVTPPKHGGAGYAFIYVRGMEANLPANAEVAVRLELGVLAIFGYPGAATQALEVAELITATEGMRVRLRNTGNMHLRPQGRVVLRDAQGAELWSGKLEPALVFAGLEREFPVDNPPLLPSGQYTAEVEVTSPAPARLTRRLAQVDGQLLTSRPAPILNLP